MKTCVKFAQILSKVGHVKILLSGNSSLCVSPRKVWNLSKIFNQECSWQKPGWLCGAQTNVSFDNVCLFWNSAPGDLVKHHMCKVAETASPPSPPGLVLSQPRVPQESGQNLVRGAETWGVVEHLL